MLHLRFDKDEWPDGVVPDEIRVELLGVMASYEGRQISRTVVAAIAADISTRLVVWVEGGALLRVNGIWELDDDYPLDLPFVPGSEVPS